MNKKTTIENRETLKPIMPSESKKSGQLPQYVTNLDELARAIYNGISSSRVIDAGNQKIKGLYIDTSDKLEQYKIVWVVDEPIIHLTGLVFFANDVRNIGYDNYFDMYINDEIIFENVYLKEIQEEYKIFTTRKTLKFDDKVTFIFYNKNKMIDYIYFNIDYIGDIKIKKYTIKCIEEQTQEVLNMYDIYLLHPSKEIVYAPIIEGYSLLYPEQIEVDTIDKNEETQLIFYYEKEKPIITHNFDYIIEVSWGTQTDLDVKCIIDNEEVWFKNKEFALNDENKMWLDHDYTSPQGYPETITILGFKDKIANIQLAKWSGADLGEIKVVIAKKINNKYKAIKTFTVNGEIFTEYRKWVDICTINLANEEVNILT